MTCDQCDYKSSISKNLNDHKKAKQPVDLIPCDLCEFVKKASMNMTDMLKLCMLYPIILGVKQIVSKGLN